MKLSTLDIRPAGTHAPKKARMVSISSRILIVATLSLILATAFTFVVATYISDYNVAVAWLIASFVLEAAAIYLVIRAGLHRLHQLNLAVLKVNRGNNIRLPESGPAEIRKLIAGFNEMAGTISDINADIQKAENRLRLTELVFDVTCDGIVVTDADNLIIDVNPAFEKHTGYGRVEIIGKHLSVLNSDRHTEEFYQSMRDGLKNDGLWKGELWTRKKTGELFAEMLTISAVRDQSGEISRYVGIFSDITLLMEHQAHLETVASHDALTQLPNRLRLQENLKLALSSARATETMVAVCYLDLDGFKPINDLHGHAAGDNLLISVSKRLKACVRANDTVARLGGDEFVVLLTGIESRRECKKAVSRMLADVSAPYDLGDERQATVTASIGIALFHKDDMDPDILLRHADQAMYQAKHGGKNRYHLFDPSMTKEMDERSRICNAITNALDAQELVLHYQPKVDMTNGNLVGVEALIRWQHPENGLLAPALFLPAIENSPLEIRVGFWVIEEAFRQSEEWKKQGEHIQVSINVPGRLLLHENFAQRVKTLLMKYPEAEGRLLQMEILESVALENIEAASEVIRECKSMGITFALDDFGTGYSSLTYLKRLDIDVLKIDQSFVRNMISAPGDFSIVEGVAWLSEAFDRIVVAEGVETDAHGAMLLRLGCQIGQGYGIAKPMQACFLIDWYKGWVIPKTWEGVCRWEKEDLALLEAEVAHRQWLADVYKVIDTKNAEIVPELSMEKSRFGRWLKNCQIVKYGESRQQKVSQLEILNIQVHELAERILEAVKDEHHDEARVGWLALTGLRDRIVSILHEMATDKRGSDVVRFPSIASAGQG